MNNNSNNCCCGGGTTPVNPQNNACGANIDMAVCEKNIQMLPMLQTYNTIVLKPNICCKKNVLTQQMMSCEDTKYVIRWDFDLNGQTITVPERCILEFDGGSLKNGTIIGQNTVFINVGDVDIWGENLTREGTWREHSGGGGSVDVDDHLSNTSTNPVQNKVITEALEEIVLPDKPYDPETHSGLGKKTLELGEDGSNILTQEDFDQENTIYVVGYDFDLDGENIQIPEGCVLDFEGGNVSNGKLISNDTKIIGQLPENTNTLYGQYYKDKEPVNYNLRVSKRVETGVEFAFLQALDYTTFNLASQGVAAFYYNNKKYHLVGCYRKEGTTDPEHPRANEVGYMLLFDENYKFLGSAKASHPEHGNGFTVRGNQIYKCTWDGIVVYNISDIVNYCSNYGYNNPQPHNETYNSTVPVQRFITTQELNIGACQDIDYDAGNNEFAIIDGISRCVIYDEDFNQKRYMTLNTDAFIANKIESNVIFQGAVLKNGILYGTAWISDYSSNPIGVDAGNNIFYAYDTYNDKLVSYEKMENPYQDGECEGLFRDPDDDNEMYYLIYWSIGSYYVCAICKVSQVNSLYGKDTKRGCNGEFVNAFVGSGIRVDNSYDYSNGPSNGSSVRPYTTIGSAIAMLFMNAGSGLIAITGSHNEGGVSTPNNPYYLPNLDLQNRMLTIRGIDGTPTLKGTIRSLGANLTLRGLRIETGDGPGIRASLGGFIYMNNVTLIGNEAAPVNSGILAVDESSIRISSVNISYYRTGLDIRKSSLGADDLSVNNCYTGIAARFTNLALDVAHINGCEEGVYVIDSPINISTISFENTNQCFCVDDSPINISGPSAITLTGYPKENEDRHIIHKFDGYRGRVNLMCSVANNNDIANVFAFINKGGFFDSTIGFRVNTSNITYNGKPIETGVYIYNNPGFVQQDKKYVMVKESLVDGNKVFDFIPTSGEIDQRPVLDSSYAGFSYYDKTLNLPVYFTGYAWREINPEYVEGYWVKVGELTNESQTFAGNNVTITTREYHSDWEGWTNAQGGTVYEILFRIDAIPFNENDVLMVVAKGWERNLDIMANYEENGGSAISIIPSTYNRDTGFCKCPSGDGYRYFNLFVRCDVEQFDGTIEFYKKHIADS